MVANQLNGSLRVIEMRAKMNPSGIAKTTNATNNSKDNPKPLNPDVSDKV